MNEKDYRKPIYDTSARTKVVTYNKT